MSDMDDRKQARAMDLPDFAHPPFARDIPNHAGTWGWVYANGIAQDNAGLLWADGNAHPLHRPRVEQCGGDQALLAWTPGVIAVWVDPRGYSYIGRITGDVDESKWVPIAEVLTDMPPYAARG